MKRAKWQVQLKVLACHRDDRWLDIVSADHATEYGPTIRRELAEAQIRTLRKLHPREVYRLVKLTEVE